MAGIIDLTAKTDILCYGGKVQAGAAALLWRFAGHQTPSTAMKYFIIARVIGGRRYRGLRGLRFRDRPSLVALAGGAPHQRLPGNTMACTHLSLALPAAGSLFSTSSTATHSIFTSYRKNEIAERGYKQAEAMIEEYDHINKALEVIRSSIKKAKEEEKAKEEDNEVPSTCLICKDRFTNPSDGTTPCGTTPHHTNPGTTPPCTDGPVTKTKINTKQTPEHTTRVKKGEHPKISRKLKKKPKHFAQKHPQHTHLEPPTPRRTQP